jgi:hypothetical protein
MESGQLSGELRCPFCDAPEPELVGRWGGQMITAQWRCAACRTYFEAIRDSFDERATGDSLGERPAGEPR